LLGKTHSKDVRRPIFYDFGSVQAQFFVNKKQEREKCKSLPYFGSNIVKYEAVKFETTFCIAKVSVWYSLMQAYRLILQTIDDISVKKCRQHNVTMEIIKRY
jgi:hypothetical protein